MPSLAKPTIRVAFQGERGAYSEEAARTLLGPEAEAVPHRTFESAFEAVAQDDARCAAGPIENRPGGSVPKDQDLMLEPSPTINRDANLNTGTPLVPPPG